ncbi:uncharacterized protein [Onthophagus taurus]|uniref:uncharacterized protein n=1 Tax=Onthophagus taurus TaxID=166361 RepID=UPI0039BECE43
MDRLADNLNIERNISRAKTAAIRACHKLVFENDGDRNNRKRLREFTGFAFENNDEKQKKLDYAIKSLTLGDLNSICNILEIPNDANNKEDLVGVLCTRLTDLNLLTKDDEANDDENHSDEDNSDNDVNNDVENDDEGNDDVQKIVPESKKAPPKFVLTFKDVEDAVSTFNGRDNCSVEKWLEEFEETAILMGWNDVEKLIYGKRLLKDDALLFIKSEPMIKSWKILKNKLKKEYGQTINSAALHKMLTTRKKRKDETITQYLLEMRQIASRGYIEEDALIDYIIDGITDDEVNKTVLYGAKCMNDFKAKLKIYEKMKSKQYKDKRDYKEKNTKDTD